MSHFMRMDRQIWLGLAMLFCLGIASYFKYFHRPPVADILAANKRKRNVLSNVDKFNKYGKHGEAAAAEGYEGYNEYYYDGEETIAVSSQRQWDSFIEDMGFVSIGVLFNKCEPGDDRETIGQTILLPDLVLGGVTSRTYINITYDKEVTGGEMYLECQYNLKDLYSNHWELCTVEEGMDDRIIYCPIEEGKHKFIKNFKIPNYLPKGRYTVKSRLTNQHDETVICAFADFTL